MNKHIFVFQGKNGFIRKTINFLLLISVLITLFTTNNFAKQGYCFNVDWWGNIRYKESCTCNCDKYGHADNGRCLRCHHRVNIEYDKIPFKEKMEVNKNEAENK